MLSRRAAGRTQEDTKFAPTSTAARIETGRCASNVGGLACAGQRERRRRRRRSRAMARGSGSPIPVCVEPLLCIFPHLSLNVSADVISLNTDDEDEHSKRNSPEKEKTAGSAVVRKTQPAKAASTSSLKENATPVGGPSLVNI